MPIVAKFFIGLIAFIHLYIFIFEAFLWEQRGPKVFRNFPKDLFVKTKELAFNQGVYNLFLAVGLAWSLCIADISWAKNIATFFLACVAVAGVAGSLTAERKIIFIQTVPALIALALIWFI